MEAIEEEILCMETNLFGNVGPTACIEPPKRPTQTAGHARPSNASHFGSDYWGLLATRCLWR